MLFIRLILFFVRLKALVHYWSSILLSTPQCSQGERLRDPLSRLHLAETKLGRASVSLRSLLLIDRPLEEPSAVRELGTALETLSEVRGKLKDMQWRMAAYNFNEFLVQLVNVVLYQTWMQLICYCEFYFKECKYIQKNLSFRRIYLSFTKTQKTNITLKFVWWVWFGCSNIVGMHNRNKYFSGMVLLYSTLRIKSVTP